MSTHFSSSFPRTPPHHSTFPSSAPPPSSSLNPLLDSLFIPNASHSQSRSKSDWTLSLSHSNFESSPSPSLHSLTSPRALLKHSLAKERKRHVSAQPKLPSISSFSISSSSSQESSISFPSHFLFPRSHSLRKTRSVGGESSEGSNSGVGVDGEWERHVENGKKSRLIDVRDEKGRRESGESVWVGQGRTFELVVGKDGLPARLGVEETPIREFGEDSWEFQVAAALLNGGVSPPSSPVRTPRNPPSVPSSPSRRQTGSIHHISATQRSRHVSNPFDHSHSNRENVSSQIVKSSKSLSNVNSYSFPLQDRLSPPPPPPPPLPHSPISRPLSTVSRRSNRSSASSSFDYFHDASDSPSCSPTSHSPPSPSLPSPPPPAFNRPRTRSFKASNRSSLSFSSKSPLFSTSPLLEPYESIDLYALTHSDRKAIEEVSTSEEGSNGSFIVELPFPFLPAQRRRRCISQGGLNGRREIVEAREGDREKGKWRLFGLFCVLFGWIGRMVRALTQGRDEGSLKEERGIGYTKEKKGEGRGFLGIDSIPRASRGMKGGRR